MLDFYVKTGIRLSLRDKWLFEIAEVEITRVDCIYGTLTVFFNDFQPRHLVWDTMVKQDDCL